ncbi:MAG: hypothetical protein PHQ41_02340 [Candidatus Cloacimonetes bacterium]|nr:hypothetical protein [Candidatus Cloacimonadota bacterium]
MAKFSAESLSAIEYDFSGFKDQDDNAINAKGFVPEPTRFLVDSVMQKIKSTFDTLEDQAEIEDTTPEAVSAAMENLNFEQFSKVADRLTAHLAELCGATVTYAEDTGDFVESSGGSPTYDDLMRLRYRPFMAFFGYVMEQVMSPEVSKTGSNSSRRLKSV